MIRESARGLRTMYRVPKFQPSRELRREPSACNVRHGAARERPQPHPTIPRPHTHPCRTRLRHNPEPVRARSGVSDSGITSLYFAKHAAGQWLPQPPQRCRFTHDRLRAYLISTIRTLCQAPKPTAKSRHKTYVLNEPLRLRLRGSCVSWHPHLKAPCTIMA